MRLQWDMINIALTWIFREAVRGPTTRRAKAPSPSACRRRARRRCHKKAIDRMAIVAVQNIISVIDGKPIKDNVINKTVLVN
jgi:hypothetical protein